MKKLNAVKPCGFSVKHKGVELTQAQLDAIVPVINQRLAAQRMSLTKFEHLCEEAMAKAGCPILTNKMN